ncbi:hypothetical protein Tco_1217987, partial [Tanacetum coccineum]
EKVFVITALKNDLRKLKGKGVVDCAAQIPIATTIVPGMFKLDLDPLAPRLLQNRDAHIDYLKHTQEQADILRGIVKQAKAKQPLDNAIYFALPCKETTPHSAETSKLELKVYSQRPKQVKNVGSSKKAKIVESKVANNSEPNHSWGSNATDVPSSSYLFNDSSVISMGQGIRYRMLHPKLIHYTSPHGKKNPYELLHDRKPDLSYLHVFGALCYPTNNSENLGKLQAKADIGIFIGYAPKKKAYLLDESYSPPASVASPVPVVDTPAPVVDTPAPVRSTGSPSSTSVDQDEPSPSTSQTTQQSQSQKIPLSTEEDSHDLEVAHMSNDPYFGIPIPEIVSKESSSSDVIHTNVHSDAPISEHPKK